MWPELEKRLGEIPKTANATKPIRPQHEVLEELVSGFRVLETRVRELQEIVGETANRSSRPFRRMHPMMVMELAHSVGRGPEDPIVLVVLASAFRDEMPWLFELAMLAYREIEGGSPEKAERALDRFRRAVEASMQGPMREGLGDSKASFHAMREMVHLIESGVWGKRLSRRHRQADIQKEPDDEAT